MASAARSSRRRGRGPSAHDQQPHRRQQPRAAGRSPTEMTERLQKVLAAAGVGSRRKCEELIAAGRVEVDRQVVTRLGTKVDPHSQEIRLDGVTLKAGRKVYYLVNKPPGVVSTSRDPAGRPRVIDLLPPTAQRLFTVGRLDMSSEGLMLVTNDGQLADRLTHPRYGVEKTYHVLVAGTPQRDALGKLTEGLHLAEGRARAKRLWVKTNFKGSTLLEMVLDEGRNREIRRLMAQIGHKVLTLKRVAIGRVRLKDLQPGQFRRLSRDELKSLRTHGRQPEASPNVRPAAAASPGSRRPGGRVKVNLRGGVNNKRTAAKATAGPKRDGIRRPKSGAKRPGGSGRGKTS